MGRWDALNTRSNRDQAWRQLPHTIKKSNKSTDSANDKSWRHSSVNEKSRITARGFSGLRKQNKYEELCRRCLQDLSTKNVLVFAEEITNNTEACFAATAFDPHHVVDQICLPYLERLHDAQRQNRSITVSEERVLCSSIQAIQAILDTDNGGLHCSSIMAPAVVAVRSDGTEVQVPNPTRKRLFERFEKVLLDPDQSTSAILVHIAQCLLSALKLANRLEGTARHAKSGNYDLDPSTVLKLFGYCRSKFRTQSPSNELDPLCLELMHALLKRHPETSKAFFTLLLTSDAGLDNSQKALSGKMSGSTILFLSMLQEPGCIYSRVSRVVDIIKCLFKSAPLATWLIEAKPQTSPRGRTSVQSTASTFRERVLDGLNNVIRITKQRLTAEEANASDAKILLLLSTVPCFMHCIPFSRLSTNRATALLASCTELVGTCADLCSLTSLPRVQQSAIDTLVQSTLGRDSHGVLLGMPLPIKVWLSCEQSDAFAANLAQPLLQTSLGQTQVQCLYSSLVRAILRTHPLSLCGSKVRWQSLIKYMISCSDSSSVETRREGALALESLLRGRKDFWDNKLLLREHSITMSVVPALYKLMRGSGDDSSTCSALLSAYGSLLPADWNVLATSSPRADHEHINLLLECAKKSEAETKLRSEACKAIGDACSSYFTVEDAKVGICRFDNDISRSICRAIFDTLLHLTDQSSNCVASIQAAAVYALGNLGHALQTDDIPAQCPQNLALLPSVLLGHIVGSNDAKLTGNAIRAIAHALCLLFRDDYKLCLQLVDFDHNQILWSSIQALTNKIKSVILLAQGKIPNLSWKQRSIVKKHGWGACNSLAAIFASGVVLSAEPGGRRDVPTEENNVLLVSLSTLLQCIEASNKMNEKVIVSSMAALRSVDVSLLAHHCRTGQLSLAGAIEECVSCVCVEQGDVSSEGEHINWAVKTSAKLMGESSLFLLHVLTCCSIADLADVVRSPSITNQTLSCLYEWMVKQNCPTRLFDAVALAIQASRVQVDVQLEQRFAGHALSLISTSYDDSDHDEADEL